MYDLVAHLATKRDLKALEKKTMAGFDRLLRELASLLNLMEQEKEQGGGSRSSKTRS